MCDDQHIETRNVFFLIKGKTKSTGKEISSQICSKLFIKDSHYMHSVTYCRLFLLLLQKTKTKSEKLELGGGGEGGGEEGD